MKKHCRPLIASGYAMASASIASAAPSFGRGGATRISSSAFVHHATRPRARVPLRRHATKDTDSTIDNPLDVVYNDNASYLPRTSSSSSWDVADDWTSLSSDVNTAASTSFASPPSSSSMMTSGNNFNVMEEAARILEEQEQVMSEWDSEKDGESNTNDSSAVKQSSNSDDFVENAVEIIASNMDYNEPHVQLYDTVSSVVSSSSSATATKDSKNKVEEDNREEEEMAFMIRCNQSPEQFLISQGRALPELTEEMKHSPSFLLEEEERIMEELLPLQPKATAFFENAVKKLFHTYSVQVDDTTEVLDRKAISRWLTACISSPLATSSKFTIGPHDQSISALLGRYSQNHGSGRLTLEEFQALYLEVTWSGYIRDLIKNKAQEGGVKSYQIPSPDAGVLIQGRKNTEKMLKQATLSIVWRDLEAHGIFSPAEEEHVQLLMEMERLQASADASAAANSNSPLLMDECELFEEYEDRLSHQVSSYSDDNENDMLGEERAWEFLKRKEKSSHELVEMAFDGKTPRRIRDGEFVFIDEESCIGCTQCAQIAPSVFQMIEESGRARTFSQKNSLDVENAVMACPVNCMHSLSFDELKEMETARDHGDGRTDHRHLGKTHTPLNVAGIDSDANHKSSWYHYLKCKCHGSAACPQRGCYDCPTYNPGENPFFKEHHKQAELTRAKDFMELGEADKWRKVAEL